MYITELLKKLDTGITFRPDTGAFRSGLVEIFITNGDEECAELFSEHSCDILISVSEHTIAEGKVTFMVISDLGEHTLECTLSALSDDAIRDLDEQLTRHVLLHPKRSEDVSPKVIIRKNVNGMLDIHQAAQKLGRSQLFLKNKIPCSENTYHEVNGKQELKEYYWTRQLINCLCDIQVNGATAENRKYITEECCEGDSKWAEEIVLLLDQRRTPPKSDAALPKTRARAQTNKQTLKKTL